MGAYDQQVYHFLKFSIVVGLVISFLFLTIGSILVADTAYIQNHPKNFMVETLLMGFLTAIPVSYLSYMRGTTSYKKIFTDGGIFFVKIVLLHIGFQLSGIYTAVFLDRS